MDVHLYSLWENMSKIERFSSFKFNSNYPSFRYIGVTLGKYPNNLSEPYDTAKERARVGVKSHISFQKMILP